MTNTLKAADGLEPETTAKEINQFDDNTETKVNAIPDTDLLEAIEIRERFQKLYSVKGFISTDGTMGIHLKDEFFLATFPEYETLPFDHTGYTKELFTEFNGVRFFCIR